MYKKAQAAMEFLMTYGWAILVVLVAIGALAYFGVLNPERFLPSSCTMVPGIDCGGDFKVLSGATAESIVYVRNGMGSNLESVTIKIGTVEGTLESASCGSTAKTINDGANCKVTFTGLTTTATGGRFKGDISFTYTKSGETLSHTVAGSITTRVEAP